MLFFALFMASAAAALAQPAAGKDPAKDSEGFVPVNGDMMQPGETIPAARLVGLAYGFIFAAVLVWVGTVARRSWRVERELESLRQKIERRG